MEKLVEIPSICFLISNFKYKRTLKAKSERGRADKTISPHKNRENELLFIFKIVFISALTRKIWKIQGKMAQKGNRVKYLIILFKSKITKTKSIAKTMHIAPNDREFNLNSNYGVL